MRFLHFSTHDGPGGAGKAALRLHAALCRDGHASRMWVHTRTSTDPTVKAAPTAPLASQLLRLASHTPLLKPAAARFTFNHDRPTGVRLRRMLGETSPPPDAICLHWVADFLTSGSIRTIYDRFRRPMLWVLMDQEPVTGGCHYSFGCDGYQRGCGNCPLLTRPHRHDRSQKVYERKRRRLAELPITFIAPTSWIEARVRASALFGNHRVERIPLAIDTGAYRVGEQLEARRRLGVPIEKPIVFFGSSYLHEERKGPTYIIEALCRMRDALDRNPRTTENGRRADPLLLMAGRNGEELKRQLPFPVHDLGYLADDAMLAAVYRAADVFVCPSIEDAGPMMIPEAMLCGTPVVAFNMGGAPDLITTGETGYLANLRDAADLARGIEAVLFSPLRSTMGLTAAHRAVKLHEPAIVARQYANLVAELNELRAAPRAAA